MDQIESISDLFCRAGLNDSSIAEEEELEADTKNKLQVPDFTVFLDRGPNFARFVPVIAELKTPKPDGDLHQQYLKMSRQILLQVKVAFSFAPHQHHVHLICIVGTKWKFVEFTKTSMDTWNEPTDDAEYNKKDWEGDASRLCSMSTSWCELLNPNGDDFHQQFKRRWTGVFSSKQYS
jgi:hypothetical protein